MEKYKRFTQEISGDGDIQRFLDEITTDGWKIIYYDERVRDVKSLVITIVGSKIQSDIL